MRGDRAQMHVLEVLMVATLFTSAVNVAVINLPTSDATHIGEEQLWFEGMELLEVLDRWAPANATVAAAYGNSTLAWWLDTGNYSALAAYLDAGLPVTSAYYLSATHHGATEVLVERGLPVSPVSLAFRLIWVAGELWELELWLWYGPRGVA